MAPFQHHLRLKPYRSDLFVIHARVGGIDYKLFQIVYRNKDGAVFVNLASYFNHTNGIVAHTLVPASGGEPVEVKLSGNPETARLTSVLVKYSHHANGYAHFSQSGKLDPARQISKTAVPLDQHSGHLFTLHAKGFPDFRVTSVDPGTIPPEKAAKRSSLVFSFPDGDPGEVKFIGGWSPMEEIYWEYAWSARNGVVGPIIQVPRPNGPPDHHVLLAPHEGTPSASRVLVLRCTQVPYQSTSNKSRIIMLGGFDPPEIVRDRDRDTTMLALMYPAETWEELQRSIMNMDLRRGQ